MQSRDPLAAALAVLLSGAFLGGALPSTPPALTFARINEKSVEVLDLKRGTWRPIYRESERWITDLGVAPSGDRIAFLAWTKGAVTGVDYSVQPRAELTVIDSSGRRLAAVPDVHKYDWCGSDRVAYIQGVYSEDSDWGFRPDGRWGLLEIASGKTTPLGGLQYPRAVAWNPLDRAVYLRAGMESPAIYRVDLATGTPAPTRLHDIHFSPSGRFYLSQPLELGTDSTQLYDTGTNTRLDISSFIRKAGLVGWVGPGDVLLAVRRVPPPARKPGEPGIRPIRPSDIRPQRYLLYRPTDGRVMAEEEGFLHEWAGPEERRLLRQGDSYKVLEGR